MTILNFRVIVYVKISIYLNLFNSAIIKKFKIFPSRRGGARPGRWGRAKPSALFWLRTCQVLRKCSKTFEEFSKKFSERFQKFLMKFFEKIKKNLKNFWKILKVYWLLWKLVPAFWNFSGFRGGWGRSPGSPLEPLLNVSAVDQSFKCSLGYSFRTGMAAYQSIYTLF